MNAAPILYAEDDQDDGFFLQHAFGAAGIQNPLHIVTDGQQAIDYLAGVGRFSDRDRHPFPCLAIFDIKLPLKTGLEVLQWLREGSELPFLPVIVFSSSARHDDVRNAYHLGVNSYVVKPADVQARLRLAQLIKGYWLEFNRAP